MAKLDPRMPTHRWHFGDVVLKLLTTHDPPMNQAELANAAGVNSNTVTNMIKGTFASTPDTQFKVAAALGTTREAMLEEVERLNDNANSVRSRSGHDRAEDKDPVMAEAISYARRIVQLEPLNRMAIYSFVASLEQATERIRKLEQQLEQAHDRNNKKS